MESLQNAKPKQIHLLYYEKITWERDFIINDLLEGMNVIVRYFNNQSMLSLIEDKNIISNSILVINGWIDFNDVLKLASYSKPKVIFYMSDEFGTQSHMIMLEKYTNVIFFQYNHIYQYDITRDYQISLGYCSGYLNKFKQKNLANSNLANSVKLIESGIIKPIVDREYNCSFIGTKKSDREHMINIFSQMPKTHFAFTQNNWVLDKQEYSPEKCFEIYNNSIYVIQGRGNSSLDCFRIYEAVVAGAIPVIVGSEQEIQNTFYYKNNIPPFIYSDNWENAFIICNNLLSNLSGLQKVQSDILNWWKAHIEFINKIIKKEFV